MDADEEKKNIEQDDVLEKSSAVNSLILDYYKKFGKKRDLEQFFSLSTAQNEIRDPSSLFWRRMKALSDSSDSGDKKSESSAELCRISIKCSIPEPSGSQIQEECNTPEESESPPIVTELAEAKESDNESENSDDVHSLKSKDGTLDTSMNKPHSPTSSVTSQRKLEWDSLADVGYGNESDKKTSASSLSTLERLALQQQYCINDTQQTSNLGVPTAHSTPVEPNDSKSKFKKDSIKKTKIFNRDVEHVQVTLPQIPETSQAFNLNLTKHITFNVDKKGEVNIENVTKNVSSSPEKKSVETDMTPDIKIDKEIQTTLNKTEKSCVPNTLSHFHKLPVHVNLNTLRKRNRKKKLIKVRQRKPKEKKQAIMHKKTRQEQKSGDQISAAESFEYMPGHIYDQNQINIPQNKCDNKSSLESSAGHTTDSSKNSFATDLDKCINVLKVALNKRHTDNDFKNKIVKDIVQRLLKARYKDDESSTEFLSGLSFDSKKLGFAESNHTTSSTSDPNHTLDKKSIKPKKSILRTDKFNSKMLPSASQSTPNIPSVVTSDIPLTSLTTKIGITSNTDTDISGKDTKTSSEELYQKYLKALRREQTYKQHLKEKELLYKQKLVRSDLRLNTLSQPDVKSNSRLKNLMNDLMRNNYDDGSGDASRLEGGDNPHLNIDVMGPVRNQRSHSVFTLSSGTSESQHRNTKLKNKPPVDIDQNACSSKSEKHYCCCPYHTSHGKIGVTDSSVQVNLHCCESKLLNTQTSQRQPSEHCALPSPNVPRCSSHKEIVRHACLCSDKSTQKIPENVKIFKCSCLNSKTLTNDNPTHQSNYTCGNLFSCMNSGSCFKLSPRNIKHTCENHCQNIQESSSSKSSQTNLDLGIILRRKNSDGSVGSSASDNRNISKEELLKSTEKKLPKKPTSKTIYEGIRWTQTDISIDPKISEASFSDVALINNKDCAKLVSEHCREVSQPASENSMKTCTEGTTDSSQTNSESKTSKKQSFNALPKIKITSTQRLDKEIQSDIDLSMFNNVGSQVNMPKLKNYTIPIQGTNMTLKVSLGNSETSSDDKTSSTTVTSKSNQKSINYESKETLTNKTTAVDNSTSLLEECSKGVQSNDTHIFKEPPKPSIFACSKDICKETCFANVNYNIDIAKNNSEGGSCRNEENKFNTYPKREQINPLKPLLRSNTDTGHMEKTSHVTFDKFTVKDKKSSDEIFLSCEDKNKAVNTETDTEKTSSCSNRSSKSKTSSNSKKSSDSVCQTKASTDSQDKSPDDNTTKDPDDNTAKDPLIDLIQNITKRYSKKDIEKSKRKKCFKELLTVLNYLLDTEETTDQDQQGASQSSNYETDDINTQKQKECSPAKSFVDKGVQLTHKKSKKSNTDSSDQPTSTDLPTTSTDSATCQVLNKIKKECEKYHQKRCKSHTSRACDASSSTSMNCDQCRRVHHCHCKGYRCHRTKATVEKHKRKCVAYNLILQTDSMASEDTSYTKDSRQLRNIVIKVPKKKTDIPFKEMASKFEKDFSHIPHCARAHISRSLPNDSEISSTEEMLKKAHTLTVREYLEINRPDFVEKSSERQNCLEVVNETRPETSPRMNMIVVHNPKCSAQCMEPCHMYCGGVPINYCSGCVNHYDNVHCTQSEVTRFASARAAKRELLSMQVAQQQALKALSESQLRELAKDLRKDLRTKKLAPKFISERAMKKHSEKIYKSLPEVVRKKDELKKESIKKTNLLLASIFKKNLQKKTLQGAVNLSNYSTIIKI